MVQDKNWINPYQVLDIPYHATESEIHQAFLDKMKNGEDPNPYINAYGLIRDRVGRNQLKWDEIFTYAAVMPTLDGNGIQSHLPGLVRELAFLSPWELGEDV